jgi:hypothetical protein
MAGVFLEDDPVFGHQVNSGIRQNGGKGKQRSLNAITLPNVLFMPRVKWQGKLFAAGRRNDFARMKPMAVISTATRWAVMPLFKNHRHQADEGWWSR